MGKWRVSIAKGRWLELLECKGFESIYLGHVHICHYCFWRLIAISFDRSTVPYVHLEEIWRRYICWIFTKFPNDVFVVCTFIRTGQVIRYFCITFERHWCTIGGGKSFWVVVRCASFPPSFPQGAIKKKGGATTVWREWRGAFRDATDKIDRAKDIAFVWSCNY